MRLTTAAGSPLDTATPVSPPMEADRLAGLGAAPARRVRPAAGLAILPGPTKEKTIVGRVPVIIENKLSRSGSTQFWIQIL